MPENLTVGSGGSSRVQEDAKELAELLLRIYKSQLKK